MTELLKRWAELEPERCRVSDAAAHLRSPFAFRIHWATLTADPINLAVVLAAVIEAIQARGWFWNVGTTLQEPVQAYVQSPERTFRPVRAETPAAALLGAYLAALEAEGEEQA